MNGWYAAFLVLPFWAAPAVGTPPAPAAQDLHGAARELARKTAALAGKGEAAAVAWRDMSSLGPEVLDQARGAFEAALRDAGVRLGEAAAACEAQITLSENQSEALLVEEIHKGDERQVWIEGWNRSGAPAAPGAVPAGGVTLDAKLLWEQEQQILHLVVNGDSMMVLSPSAFTSFIRNNGTWRWHTTIPIPVTTPSPRDPRGRLRLSGPGLQVWRPGVACDNGIGVLPMVLSCRPSNEPWTLESGHALLLADFASGLNYFDGRVVSQAGVRKTVPPFYAAVATEDESARPVWLLTMLDGTAQVFDASLDPAGGVLSGSNAWGSDIAGVHVRCGGRSPVLATRPGDGREGDAVRAFAIINRAAVPVSAPVELPGPVTVLWPAGGNAVTAVVRNLATEKYQAYAITVACGP